MLRGWNSPAERSHDEFCLSVFLFLILLPQFKDGQNHRSGRSKHVRSKAFGEDFDSQIDSSSFGCESRQLSLSRVPTLRSDLIFSALGHPRCSNLRFRSLVRLQFDRSLQETSIHLRQTLCRRLAKVPKFRWNPSDRSIPKKSSIPRSSFPKGEIL